MGRLRGWLQRRGLQLNEEKTRKLNARKEGFAFLGWQVTPRRTKYGTAYHHREPSVKSGGRLMEKIRDELNRRTLWKPAEEVIGKVNQVTRGWSAYFQGRRSRAIFHQMNGLLAARLRRRLWHKHHRKHAAYGHYTKTRLYTEYGLYRMTVV